MQVQELLSLLIHQDDQTRFNTLSTFYLDPLVTSGSLSVSDLNIQIKSLEGSVSLVWFTLNATMVIEDTGLVDLMLALCPKLKVTDLQERFDNKMTVAMMAFKLGPEYWERLVIKNNVWLEHAWNLFSQCIIRNDLGYLKVLEKAFELFSDVIAKRPSLLQKIELHADEITGLVMVARTLIRPTVDALNQILSTQPPLSQEIKYNLFASAFRKLMGDTNDSDYLDALLHAPAIKLDEHFDFFHRPKIPDEELTDNSLAQLAVFAKLKGHFQVQPLLDTILRLHPERGTETHIYSMPFLMSFLDGGMLIEMMQRAKRPVDDLLALRVLSVSTYSLIENYFAKPLPAVLNFQICDFPACVDTMTTLSGFAKLQQDPRYLFAFILAAFRHDGKLGDYELYDRKQMSIHLPENCKRFIEFAFGGALSWIDYQAQLYSAEWDCAEQCKESKDILQSAMALFYEEANDLFKAAMLYESLQVPFYSDKFMGLYQACDFAVRLCIILNQYRFQQKQIGLDAALMAKIIAYVIDEIPVADASIVNMTATVCQSMEIRDSQKGASEKNKVWFWQTHHRVNIDKDPVRVFRMPQRPGIG